MTDRGKGTGLSICGMLTLYSPLDSYIKNIETYIMFIDKLYVVDNSPIVDNTLHVKLLEKYPKVEILASGKNNGIAGALNICANIAIDESYLWMLTMDQDSYFEDDQALRFFNSVSLIDQEKVAILSPSHEIVLDNKKNWEFEKKDTVMTSGNLLNLSLVKNIGTFDEDLFIDCVDQDYCLRANMMGKDILQSTNCYIHHKVGMPYASSFIFGYRKRTFNIHSPKRVYFIVRNSLWINNKYKKEFPVCIQRHKKAIYLMISKLLRYGNNKSLYVKYIIKALFDYYTSRYGNRVDI